MKRILDKISKEKTQKLLFIGLLVLVFGAFMLSIFSATPIEENPPVDNGNVEKKPNENTIPNQENKPTPEPKEKYKIPCNNSECSVIRHFYSIDDDAQTQEMSLIQVGTKYQTSKGVTFKKEDDSSFDVYATLSGTVTEVVESPLYGYVITIDHGDNVKSEYVGVAKVLVQTGDKVNQGDVICSSGIAEYDALASNHVHFRLSVDGKYVDPEDAFDKEK